MVVRKYEGYSERMICGEDDMRDVIGRMRDSRRGGYSERMICGTLLEG